MKITLKLNIGNYQSIDFTTNEYEDDDDCYDELMRFLRDWIDITSNAIQLRDHIQIMLSKRDVESALT